MPTASNGGKILDRAVEGINWAVAVLLLLAAVTLILSAVFHFFSVATDRGIETATLRVIEELLLVFMLAEIVHTVGISIRKGSLACEPFLVVGVISAVRRMLIVTAEAAKPTPGEERIFELMMLELGLLAGLILALTAGIFLLRRAQQKS